MTSTLSVLVSLYISLGNYLREFDLRSKHFLLADHFTNSHNHFSRQCTVVVGRNLRLVNLETKN